MHEQRSIQREKDPNVKKNMDRKCRMCGVEEEIIFHVIASCAHLPSTLYLNARQNPVAQALYNDIVADVAKAERTNSYKKLDPVTRTGPLEIWWDREIQTATKMPHNRPDVVVWNAKEKSAK